MTDPTTEELLRAVGRELEAIQRNTARTAQTLGWLLFLTLLGWALAAVAVFGA